MITTLNLQKNVRSQIRKELLKLCPSLKDSISNLKIHEIPLCPDTRDSRNEGLSVVLYLYIRKDEAKQWGDHLCQVAYVCGSLLPYKCIRIVSGLDEDCPYQEYEIPVEVTLNSSECKSIKEALGRRTTTF